nr:MULTISPECIES: SUMF1/EgtB/PvdO family nonheme iron enzyme [Pseudofrankia]
MTRSWKRRSGGRTRCTGRSAARESVSWWDAVRFCNALSRQAGLPPAYRAGAGEGRVEWDVATGDGYRLSTEAEWNALLWSRAVISTGPGALLPPTR